MGGLVVTGDVFSNFRPVGFICGLGCVLSNVVTVFVIVNVVILVAMVLGGVFDGGWLLGSGGSTDFAYKVFWSLLGSSGVDPSFFSDTRLVFRSLMGVGVLLPLGSYARFISRMEFGFLASVPLFLVRQVCR